MKPVEDVPFHSIDGKTLLGRLYRPSSGATTWVVDAHGGAWRSGDRLNNEVIHRDLATHGIGVFALNFRLSEESGYPGPVKDVNYGVRWFKKHAAELGLDAVRVGGLGSSSGAQQLGLVALHPDHPAWRPDDVPEGNGVLDFFVACWPILDPLARYRMAKATASERLVEATDIYFPDEAALSEGNPYLLLQREEITNRPRMLIIQGTADQNVEHHRADMFAELYLEKGGQIEVVKFPDQPHTFITNEPEAEASVEATKVIRNFILGL